MKAQLVPMRFAECNVREQQEYDVQMERLKEMYSDVATFMPSCFVGEMLPKEAEAILFPQMIFAAYRHDEALQKYELPMVVLTSSFGTVEMWDWEIITYLRDLGCRVISPYNIDIAKTVLRALATKKKLAQGARFLMFQDTPGEGMQANIFKKFYWWEEQSTSDMEEVFGCKIIYRSWKKLNEQASEISDEQAIRTCAGWDLELNNISQSSVHSAVKLYIAIKDVIAQVGGVEGVGANCLNESFHSETTPCLAWNMLFECDNILWACEGDTLTLLSTFILYRSLKKPIMMTNLYPFLVGMAALAHEKIESFPDIEDPDQHALGVHCGYFGLAPRAFCSDWTLCPGVLEIVPEKTCMVDCRFPLGAVTLAKVYPGFRKLSVIEAQLERYVQYPGSDCRNGALIKYKDGHKVMEALSSHHSLILVGDVRPQLRQVASIFGWEVVEL